VPLADAVVEELARHVEQEAPAGTVSCATVQAAFERDAACHERVTDEPAGDAIGR
jgi:hypothetical protein